MKKKTVLYHTVCSSGKENDFFEQLRGSLAAFFEQKEAIILLWYQENYEFESEIAQREYEKIKEQYLALGIGNVVKKETLQEAKNMAELYYGDNIAIALEFLAKGKKAVNQQMGNDYRLWASLLDKECLWTFVDFGENGKNGLYRIDRKTWNAEYVSSPEQKLPARCFGSIHRKENKLYCIPLVLDYLAIYDIESGIWEKIYLPASNYKVFWGQNNYFREAVIYKDYIYMFADLYPGIAKYDMLSKKISYMPNCAEKYMEEGCRFFVRKLHQEGNNILFYSRHSKKIMKFDMDTEVLQSVLNLQECPCFDCFEIVGDDFWLIAGWKDSVALKVNRKTEEKRLIRYNSNIDEEREIGYLFSHVANGKIWALPGLLDKALKIDLKKEVVEVSKEFEPSEIGVYTRWPYNFFCKAAELLYAGTSGKKIVEYNTKTNERGVHTLSFSNYHNAYTKTDKDVLGILLEEAETEQRIYVADKLSNGEKIWKNMCM